MPNNFDVYIDDSPDVDVIGICPYHYIGLRSANKNSCANRIETREVHNGKSREEKFIIYNELLDVVQSFACDRIVIRGFHRDYETLFQVFKDRSFENVSLIWPGSYIHMGDVYTRNSFLTVVDLYTDGLIKVIGFDKKGFDYICDILGFDTYHVPSFYDVIPKGASPISDDGLTHIGIFQAYDAWYKRSYSMLASTVLMSNVAVHLHGGMKKHLVEYIDLMNINLANGHGNKIPHHKMPEALSSMDIVLYVTFCEGSPILPLESLGVGTPCLIGPCSDLFLSEYPDKDYASEYLYDTLVVPHPDDAVMIAEYAINALDNKRRIIEHYEHFAVGYNSWCKQEFKKFVDLMG